MHSRASSQVRSGKYPFVVVKVQPSLLVISPYKCSCLIEVDTNQRPFGRTYHNMKIRPQKLVIVLGHGLYWNNVVGEVPIQVDSPEGRSHHKGTDREHMSIGTSM